MRLDKFLKVSRIIRRRTVANEACDAARVTLNGRPAKAGAQVKVGDVAELKFGDKTLKFRILSDVAPTGKQDCSAMYEVIQDEI